MEITFDNPLYLVFLVSLPLLVISHFFTLRYLQRRALRFANFEAIRRVTGSDKVDVRNSLVLSRSVILLFLRICVLISLIFAAAGPTLWMNMRGSTLSYVLAIDASSSMLADDFDPTRLNAAKSAALIFLSETSPSTRIGIVTFSGTSFVEQPITDDKGLVKEAVKEIGVRQVGGTDLATAIITSANLLENEDAGKVVILLTDGQSTVGPEVNEGIQYARENHVMVHTVGVGTTKGGSFIRTDTSIVSKIDAETLNAIALETGGHFFSAEDKDALEQSFRDITEFDTRKTPIRLHTGLALAGLLLIFIEWGLVSTKFRTIP